MTPEEIQEIMPEGYGGDWELTCQGENIYMNFGLRLDEILNTLGERHIMVEHRLVHLGMPEQNGKNIETRKAKQAILHWVADEVIGEDKIPPTVAALSPEFLDAYYKGRKHLRLEQRQILAQHGYKGDKR